LFTCYDTCCMVYHLAAVHRAQQTDGRTDSIMRFMPTAIIEFLCFFIIFYSMRCCIINWLVPALVSNNKRVLCAVLSTEMLLLQTITISLSTDLAMLRGSSDAATVSVEIWSIGVFDSQRNVQYTRDVYRFLMDTLQLPPER